jgi:hypothetical protein
MTIDGHWLETLHQASCNPSMPIPGIQPNAPLLSQWTKSFQLPSRLVRRLNSNKSFQNDLARTREMLD